MSDVLPETPEQRARERFLADTSEHVMQVLHDQGLYRHLRFAKLGTVVYSFDIITWPGYLSITGDCGTFLFAHTSDMFNFFAPEGKDAFADQRWGINPAYWAEKLRAPSHDAAKAYSYDLFKERVWEWFESVSERMEPERAESLRQALVAQVTADHLDTAHNNYDAHRALYEFEHDGIHVADSWEWSFLECRWNFLWCCWAIVWGIGQYRQANAATA